MSSEFNNLEQICYVEGDHRDSSTTAIESLP